MKAANKSKIPPIIHVKVTRENVERISQQIKEKWRQGEPIVFVSHPDVTITAVYPVSPKRARFLRGNNPIHKH